MELRVPSFPFVLQPRHHLTPGERIATFPTTFIRYNFKSDTLMVVKLVIFEFGQLFRLPFRRHSSFNIFDTIHSPFEG